MHARGREMEQFFKPVARRLPDPHGDLAKLVPTPSIKQANKHVEDVMSKGKQGQEYQKVSIELKSKVAKYAAENGIKAAIKKFQDMIASNTARKF